MIIVDETIKQNMDLMGIITIGINFYVRSNGEILINGSNHHKNMPFTKAINNFHKIYSNIDNKMEIIELLHRTFMECINFKDSGYEFLD